LRWTFSWVRFLVDPHRKCNAAAGRDQRTGETGAAAAIITGAAIGRVALAGAHSGALAAGRTEIATQTTAIATSKAVTTIRTWVCRSAVQMEEFMVDSQVR
jgi:hypothetical protein